jgi:hypothetical protein
LTKKINYNKITAAYRKQVNYLSGEPYHLEAPPWPLLPSGQDPVQQRKMTTGCTKDVSQLSRVTRNATKKMGSDQEHTSRMASIPN